MSIYHPEWLNLNSERSYPIKENCNRLDTTGTFQLPNQLILDAIFTVEDEQTVFFIKEVKLYQDNIIIKIHDNSDVFVGSVNIETQHHNNYDFYYLTGHGGYKNISGKLVIGDLTYINDSFLGKFEFDINNTSFEDTVLVPSVKGISSLSVNNEEVIIGDVKLIAGYNIRLRYIQEENAIYFDAIDSEGLGQVCVCDEEEETSCLERINGIFGPNVDIRGIG